ncbi:MAG TPA: cbb3-type cytochrome c oxidase subunit I [Candidatus Bathyarchaeia archaeon]|nr:cbb3-type cytochrome c oxidase subunit I [Candidatus Bathyarchaeia archaeon]
MTQQLSNSTKRWLYTTNHKDIGILYIVTSLFFFVAAGLLALTMRSQLSVPDNNLLTPEVFNQFVTVHGLLMVFWVLSPLAFGFANYIIPLQIGARDLAFPRLNAMSYWFYLFSGVTMILSFFFGAAPDLGWTLYSPQTSFLFTPTIGLNLGAAALILITVSITMSSVNFLVTMFKMRAPGLKLRYMSVFPWAILVTIFMMLYAFPSFLAAVLLLYVDRAFGTAYFSSIQGGSLLWDNVFWFFGHPEVYIVLFPAIGIIADVIPTFARRPLYGSKYVIGALIAAALISFVVWGHHMFVTGIGIVSTKLYTVTTIAVSLPFDVMVISLIETLAMAKIKLKAAALFTLGAVALFTIGGITGVYLASVALDYALRGTYFVVAHFHYIMVGASIMGLIGGLYYWFPKITGRMYNEGLAKIHFILSFIGVNVLYFPMFLLLDMPRRIATYTPETGWAVLNLTATVGGFIFGGAQLLLFYNLWRSARIGLPSGPNPWGGWTLEWALPSPPPVHDFDSIPAFTSDGTIHFEGSPGLPNGLSHGNGISHGNGLDAGKSSHDAHLEGLSPWPILMSFAAFIFFLGITIGKPAEPQPVSYQPFWPLIADGVILGILSLYGYSREKFTVHENSHVESWPFKQVSNTKLGIWTFLGAEVIFFGVLIGAYFFVRTNSPAWPIPGTLFEIRNGFAMTLILLTSSLTAIMALASAKAGNRNGLIASLGGTLALGAAFLYVKAGEWFSLGASGVFKNYPLPATSYFITTGTHGVHVVAGMCMTVYLLVNAIRGKYVKGDSETLEHFGLYWHFVDIVWVFLFPLFYLI